MATDFDPNSCPVGISNSKEIINVGDRLDMAIERLTEKVDDVKESVTSLSNKMDRKFDAVDKKFEAFDKRLDDMNASVDKKFEDMNAKMDSKFSNVPKVVDDEIEKKRGSSATQAWKWVLSGFLGSIIIALVTSYVKSKLGF